jgi:dephospho-CoA kinase
MAAASRALRIGLTGGIGSGKSTVATLLAERGAAIVDTDLIARELTLPGGAAIPAIATAFGARSIDASGALDRALMRELVFADPSARQRLEAILHPLISLETERRAAAASAPAIVFDVPLLVESGRWAARVDRVWVVDCSEAAQRARVMARSGWSEAAVDAVIAQQASRAARRTVADAVVHNEGLELAELGRQVQRLWEVGMALMR